MINEQAVEDIARTGYASDLITILEHYGDKNAKSGRSGFEIAAEAINEGSDDDVRDKAAKQQLLTQYKRKEGPFVEKRKTPTTKRELRENIKDLTEQLAAANKTIRDLQSRLPSAPKPPRT